jgi:dTDP-4-dehydrorhamnose 3,5-epimerase
MQFHPVGESDARLISLQVHRDERGSFARTWCSDLFAQAGIDFTPTQANTSYTRLQGSIRGMHFQRAPLADAKLIRCVVGRIHDVIVDLREDSPTRGVVYAQVLTGEAGAVLYAPAGFAHGFQTLTHHVVVEYVMGAPYAPELYDGFRYDDPALGIAWPLPVTSLSDNDARWAPLAKRLPWLGPARVPA